ncbi:MAG: T9SS type A sorting domain-containing protein [bacterium]|nr:T9SS type A sorting domain-containing protein [bacterium]
MCKLNKNIFFLLFCILGLSFNALSQYAPQAGIVGTTAIHKDSSIIKIFDNYEGQSINRGWQNIADTSLGKASVGSVDSLGDDPKSFMLSLGDGGAVEFKLRTPVLDGLGPDFVIFENGFPFSSDSFFLELAFVEVSVDGEKFYRFPAYSETDTAVQVGPFGGLKAHQIHNLAGKYIAPYGVPFDLNDLKVSLKNASISYIRIVDAVGSINPAFGSKDAKGRIINDPWPTPFPSSGFDLNAIGFINFLLESVKEEGKEQVLVFPNPVNIGSNLEVILPQQFCAISITDIYGNEVYSYAEASIRHRFSANFGEGLYFMKVTNTHQKSYITKIIIQP